MEDKELLLLKVWPVSGEIGKMLNIPASTVESRLVTARKHFKQALYDCGVVIDG